MVSHESTKPKKGFEFVVKCETFFFQCTITRNNFEKELTPVVNKLQQAANQYRVFIDKQI